MSVVSLTLTKQQIDVLKESLNKYNDIIPPQYANFKIAEPHLNITVYNSNKVVFQGHKAVEIAQKYMSKQIFPQAGSDETGNGSYFGPLCVAAVYIDDEIYEKIKHLKIDDSKATTDAYINEIAPYLREVVPHSLVVLDNTKYNQIQKSLNQNAMKAMLHNQVFLKLSEHVKMPALTVIDQFTPKQTYFKYLDANKPIYHDLKFETKAESKYLAVAAASIIARYAFNQALLQLSDHYGMSIPSGAGKTADEAARAFINRFGEDELKHVVKLHFANTKRLK